MKIKRLNNRGDTIVEVLICIAILGLIVAAAYTLTNRNQLTAQQSQERSEALKIANTQLELLRSYGETQPLTPLKNSYFCVSVSGSVLVVNNTPTPAPDPNNDAATAYNGSCQQGPDQRYRIAVWGYGVSSAVNADNTGKNVFAVTVRWESVKGGVAEEVKTFYTTYDSTGDADPDDLITGPPGPTSSIWTNPPGPVAAPPNLGTTVYWSTEPSATSCQTVNFPGPATFNPALTGYSGNFPTGPLTSRRTYEIQCFNGLGDPGNSTSITVFVRRACYTAYTAPYPHVTYWHDHGYDYPVYATSYWWQHTGPGWYYGGAPWYYPNPHYQWEANSVAGGPSPVLAQYSWPGSPAASTWRNRYELWSGQYIAYWAHAYVWHYHEEDWRGDPYTVCPPDLD